MALWPFNQHRPRLRRFAKWLGVVVVLLVAAADVWSVRWYVGLSIREPYHEHHLPFQERVNGRVYLMYGQIVVVPRAPSKEPGRIRYDPPVREGLYHSSRFEIMPLGNGLSEVRIPLWAPALLVTLPTAWLWWRDRPARRRLLMGQCRTCGYDRTGLENKPCPECGCGDSG